jgi:pimeloyl-ACP methyl ester carboxylesterase
MLQEEYQVAIANGIELVYDTFGNPDSPPVLLIMGLGNQMIDWREEFCSLVADRGYWVIRFENRDVGKSQKFNDAEMPNVLELAVKIAQGESVEVPYSINDMAADAIGLLDVLKIDQAHVVGLSMGGMIAQTMAIYYRERLKTLTSLMSSARYMFPPSTEAAELLNKSSPDTREEYIEYYFENSKILGGPKYQYDENMYREHAGRRFDRGIYPPGFARQLAAVITQEDRRDALRSLDLPTLVLHGTSDPLVPVEGGTETAEAVPNSKIRLIEGWGHGFPPSIWPIVIDELVAHFKSI